MQKVGVAAKQAAASLRAMDTQRKNQALAAIADAVWAHRGEIVTQNSRDLALAQTAGLSSAMIDRLILSESRIEKMAEAVRQVVDLPDPVGKTLSSWTRPNGLQIAKRSVPIGVIGFVYESRPNVTTDAIALCLKSGNACILRGGSEAMFTNQAICSAVQQGLSQVGLPASVATLVADGSRESVGLLCQLDEYVDLLIARGGTGLISAVKSQARMPVINHYAGICAVYVDSEADLGMAAEIVENAKCQRPGVCNALETVLVHRDVAEKLWSALQPRLAQRKVEVRGDAATLPFLGDIGRLASPEDFETEFLDLILAAKIVDSPTEAIDHINRHGSHHSDSIVTTNPTAAELFQQNVDSAVVYWNASTRFTDGGEFGFGAEIGISTDKLHARGPMGLAELTTYKYVVVGTGQIRA